MESEDRKMKGYLRKKMLFKVRARRGAKRVWEKVPQRKCSINRSLC